MKPKDQVLEVWGDFACFTRPELKVERFSYPVITPSAARGIYDAIYCKPVEFRWQVTEVEILAPVNYIALRRNEVKGAIPEKLATQWASGRNAPRPMLVDDRTRAQRQTMALKGVHYRLHAEIRPWPGFESGLQGMEMQFRRRAANGKCIYQPYFGCREFPAFFDLVEPDSPPASPVGTLCMDIGLMLYDVFDLSKAGRDHDPPCISLFQARVEAGVLKVPEYESNEVLRGIRRER